MATDNWYLNKTWNNEIETNFELRLKRSRYSYNKAQYLRIQATCLLDSAEKTTQMIGISLMERLIVEFPTEEFSTIFGQEQLGDYFLKESDFDKAEKYFRIVTDYYETKKTRSGTSGKADLKLAETFLTAGKSEKLQEAYSICMNYPKDDLIFNDDRFYYTELTAHICDKLNKIEEAKDFAKSAIEISKITEPQFYRHKTVGLVKATEIQLRTLEQIANE
jgi:tetratricopeptide (TPR) repeat protein